MKKRRRLSVWLVRHHPAPGAWCARTLIVLAALACSLTAVAQTGELHPCGDPFTNHFGPWDYRTARKADIEIVEHAHFTRGVETMTTPKNTMMHTMAGDVSYVLTVFPNHHRALLTMWRLSEKYKSDPPPGTKTTVDCWFDRAVRYRPDDTVVRAFFAQYLAKQNRRAEALAQLEAATHHAKDNPLSHLNIGLLYFEMDEFDRALAQAHKAQALGFPRPDLIDKLKRAGKWSEPPR